MSILEMFRPYCLYPLVGLFLLGRGMGGEGSLEEDSQAPVFIPRENTRWDGMILRAVDLIRQGELRPGIQLLQDVVDSFSSSWSLRAVPEDFGPMSLIYGRINLFSAKGSNGGKGEPSRLYLPVAEVARQLLAGLSPEGIRVYRKLYDSLAETTYRSALKTRDLELLRRVAVDYFPSSSGNAARDKLADALFEKGHFCSALSHWKSILAGWGGIEPSPLEVRLKILAALRLLGERREYFKARSQFHAELRLHAGSDGLAGAEEILAGWLSEYERKFPFPLQDSGTSASPGASDSSPPPLPGSELGLDWKSEFWSFQVPSFGTANFARGIPHPSFRSSIYRILEPIRVYSFFPTPSSQHGDDFVYVNGIFRFQRLSATTGRVELPLYRYPILRKEVLFFREESDSPIYHPTLAESGRGWKDPGFFPGVGIPVEGDGPSSIVIYSFVSDRVEPRDYMNYEITAEIPTRSLAAFDRETGRLLWHTGSLDLGKPGKVVSITTPALVRGNRVFAGGWQQIGYVNSVVVALDISTGALLWSQLLASNQLELTMFGELGREPFASILAEREGTIYCQTNLGALAALDAVTGQIQWLTTYDAIPVEPAEGRRSPYRDLVWSVNPPLFIGDTLIVTPRDSHWVYGVEVGSVAGRATSRCQPGRILWSYQNARRELRDLLGSTGGNLYFTGPAGVQALDIRNLSPQGTSQRIPSTIRWGKEELDGRGALTDAGVVVVAVDPGIQGAIGDMNVNGESRVWLVDFSLKKRTCLTGPLYEKWGLHGPRIKNVISRRWPSQEQYLPFAGNVTVIPGRILLTSRTVIASFSPRPLGTIDARPTSRSNSNTTPMEGMEDL